MELEDVSINLMNDSSVYNCFRYDQNDEFKTYLAKKKDKSRKIKNSSHNSVDGRTTNLYNDGGK